MLQSEPSSIISQHTVHSRETDSRIARVCVSRFVKEYSVFFFHPRHCSASTVIAIHFKNSDTFQSSCWSGCLMTVSKKRTQEEITIIREPDWSIGFAKRERERERERTRERERERARCTDKLGSINVYVYWLISRIRPPSYTWHDLSAVPTTKITARRVYDIFHHLHHTFTRTRIMLTQKRTSPQLLHYYFQYVYYSTELFLSTTGILHKSNEKPVR